MVDIGASDAIAVCMRLVSDIRSGVRIWSSGCELDPRVPCAWFGLFEPRMVREVGDTGARGAYRVSDLIAVARSQLAFSRAFARIKEHLPKATAIR